MIYSIDIPHMRTRAKSPRPAYEIVIQVNAQTQVVDVLDITRASRPTLRIPMQSFQTRHSTGNKPWVAVYIPGDVQTLASISAYLDGQAYMSISRGYRYSDGTGSAFAEIARACLEDMRWSEGASNSTFTLSGYNDAAVPAYPKNVIPAGVQIREFGSNVRIRASAETAVAPGDSLLVTLPWGAQYVPVASVEYVVTTELQYVDITSADLGATP